MNQFAYGILPSNIGYARVHPLPVSISNAIRNLLLTKVDKSPDNPPDEDVKEITDGASFVYEPSFDDIKGDPVTDTFIIRFEDDDTCSSGEMTFETTDISTTGPIVYKTKITYNDTKILTVNSDDVAEFSLPTTVNLDSCDYQIVIQPEFTNAPKYRISLTFNRKL